MALWITWPDLSHRTKKSVGKNSICAQILIQVHIKFLPYHNFNKVGQEGSGLPRVIPYTKKTWKSWIVSYLLSVYLDNLSLRFWGYTAPGCSLKRLFNYFENIKSSGTWLRGFGKSETFKRIDTKNKNRTCLGYQPGNKFLPGIFIGVFQEEKKLYNRIYIIKEYWKYSKICNEYWIANAAVYAKTKDYFNEYLQSNTCIKPCIFDWISLKSGVCYTQLFLGYGKINQLS